MLLPKKVKFRKWQTQRSNPKMLSPDTRGFKLAFGSYGIKSVSQARVKSIQIESARKVISRTLTKAGKYWIRIFPDRPYTSKPAEVGMGKGKGDPQGYCFDVLPGRIIFEVDGVEEAIAHEALRKAGTKLPLKTRIIGRTHKQ
ncbi:50S ribosomal protein L16 [Candidatus Nomurabacteria bacterium RIFCSPHIGHO2_02_FULL_37_45]|uniref:50S ribosomal protein L16 n=2 Tax=Candidatus Nomuraibacteriota TaxID=1752729 RepID=A0A1F6Y387_9BACT|nr:MAG: 50S ribosomal protein L16 [Candidatus Nomurabacteria bacterium RIFCSPHIGHO2_01_FULL_37_110]OGI72332.1 MAG: 50S ribosomal protein L16 [Candidatus Nomurabacteria bacterium RIFCSPHIGHO2_02_FULL_37_45]OGI79214.1 MAG: 50S ribosomal protein L16 [Candidatus Nomurabacteria bacterium RIFCSPHIGHO2_12_FULL_37_29]OGI85070.1 MAG: 50S ribosomal protein L16 [Candidatus Nomurabacteria bacterium RIFCSPLOWO2_01_FULL_37_49]OGJ00847.1 MAG: 50S ribosomal protein L16 [Candidatus Nomurabacteria bacterium RIFC